MTPDQRLHAEHGTPPVGTRTIYGVPLVVVSTAVAYVLYLHAAGDFWLIAFVAVALLLVVMSSGIFLYAYSSMLFGTLVASMAGYLDPDDRRVATFGVACLLLIALSHRMVVRSRGGLPSRAVRAGLTMPALSAQDRPSPPSLRAGELGSLLLLPTAWFTASWFIGWATNFDTNVARSGFGLLPPTFVAVRMALVCAVILLICRGIFNYLQTLSSTDRQAGMILRQELWTWNGREQRIVAKAVRRAKSRQTKRN